MYVLYLIWALCAIYNRRKGPLRQLIACAIVSRRLMPNLHKIAISYRTGLGLERSSVRFVGEECKRSSPVLRLWKIKSKVYIYIYILLCNKQNGAEEH